MRLLSASLPARAICLSLFVAVLAVSSCADAQPEDARPNVLFILVDDLRPELGCYGVDQAISPNIDRLAASGTRFTRAVCNVPVCGASRASLMTGFRPTRERFLNYYTRIDEDAPEAQTLMQTFKSAGYTTVGMGKVLHHGDDAEEDWSESVWDYVPHPSEAGLGYVDPDNAALARSTKRGHGPAFEAADVPDSHYGDGQIAEEAVRRLDAFRKTKEPFFLAVGFRKPHLPFNAPQRYWDLYADQTFELPTNYYWPTGLPNQLHHNSGELHRYKQVPEAAVFDTAYAVQLIRAYYASMSYLDAQVGKVLDALTANGLAEETIVVLLGDHGYNLGDHTLWNKHTLFRSALQVPLLMRVPGGQAGQASSAVAEFVDVYPTLCAAVGIEAPAAVAGTSLLPILTGAVQESDGEAYTRWHEGDNLTTERYSYSEWVDSTGTVIDRVLFDHETDPMELENLAAEEDQVDRVAVFSERLAKIRGR